VKSDQEVTINGVVVVSLSTPYFPASRPVTDDIERSSKIIEAAAERIWRSTESSKGLVSIERITYEKGDKFPLTIPELSATVIITLQDKSMVVEYEASRVFFPLQRPTPLSPEDIALRRLDAAYHGMIYDLRTALLVVKGGGYAYVFPLSDGEAVRSALGEIPAKAEVELVDPYEGTYYKPLTIAGILWTSGVISDVMRHHK
jgi:hypothetical protein